VPRPRLLHEAGAQPVLAARRADRHGRIDGLVDNAAVSLVVPSITATEFNGGGWQPEQPAQTRG
jgi:hypothetical protein